jgi:hypothetical protein
MNIMQKKLSHFCFVLNNAVFFSSLSLFQITFFLLCSLFIFKTLCDINFAALAVVIIF